MNMLLGDEYQPMGCNVVTFSYSRDLAQVYENTG